MRRKEKKSKVKELRGSEREQKKKEKLKIEIRERCGGEKKEEKRKEKKRNVWRRKWDKGKIKNPNWKILPQYFYNIFSINFK